MSYCFQDSTSVWITLLDLLQVAAMDSPLPHPQEIKPYRKDIEIQGNVQLKASLKFMPE